MGRALLRAFAKRRRIEKEAKAFVFTTARIVGFTKDASAEKDDALDHFAVVEYKANSHEVTWAETQVCDKRDYELDAVVNIMWRPKRPRSVMMAPSKKLALISVAIEKNLDVILLLLSIFIIGGTTTYDHGIGLDIFGPFCAALFAGLVFGYLTKDRDGHEDKLDAAKYQKRCDRLISAQALGLVPCYLEE